jgi:CRISPR/Cas system CMR-associated protein Cmr1 (group 7 of RAMP superfamily)
MGEYKGSITVNLKQHSLYINFEGDKKGSGLRATELVPKINKYIKALKEEDALYVKYSNEIKKIKKSKNNLYKIYIKNKDKLEKDNKNTSYFGDYKLYTYKIDVEIFSYNEKISNLVKQALREVLVYENFGTRQSKGFGSFTIDNMDKDEFERILLKKYHKKIIHKNIDDINKIMSEINNDYKKIKGKNDSILIESVDTISEKTVISKIIYNNSKSKALEGKYINALLGLAGRYIYNVYKDGKKYKVTVNIKDSGREIERFQSPLKFKVFENNIYIVCDEIPQVLLNRKFNFNLNNRDIPIYTPEKFDIQKFIEKVCKKLNYKEVSSK